MPRAAVLLLLLASPVAAQDLPPGAVARMGEVRFRAGGPVKHLALSPDGKQFTTRTGTEQTTWDANTGLPLRAEKARAEERRAELVKSGTGKFAVHVFGGTESATTIDLGAEGADALRLSEDGNTVLVFRKARPNGWTATAWDVRAGKPQPPVAVPATDVLILSPKGDALVLPVTDAREWGFDRFAFDTGKREPLARWPRDADPRAPGAWAFAPHGRAVAITVGPNTHVLDVSEGKELGRLEGHTGDVTAVAWSADGTQIATADAFGLVRVWNATTLRPLEEAKGHRAPVRHAELSPNGKLLLTWAEDGAAIVWDCASGRELRAFADARGRTPPAFAPDGTALVYRTARGRVVRDIQTGLELTNPIEAPEPRTGFAPKAFATEPRATESNVELIECATGDVRRVLRGHRGEARVLGFTPDGTKLLTAAGDHTVLVWDVRLQAVPLPPELKAETSAAKLWAALETARSEPAYNSMARLAREPAAAVKFARTKLKPVLEVRAETDSARLADARAIELIEAVGSDDAVSLLKELARGEPTAFRTQEARRALERRRAIVYTGRE
jgi:hypothetical protein